MIILYLYFISLFIAPQLWWAPMKGIPTDYILYAIWSVYVISKNRARPFQLLNSDKFLIYFVIWVLLSLIANASITLVMRDTGSVAIYYLKLVWLYILIVLTVEDITQLRSAVFFYLLIAALLGIEGIQHKLTGIGWAGQTLGWIDPEVLAAGGTGRTRWVGIFDGPGVFCVIYTIALPFLLERISAFYSPLKRFFAGVVLVITGIAIYFNGSRGGFLTALAIVIMYFGRNLKASKVQVVVGIVLAIFVFMIAPSYLTTMDDSSKSGYHRIEMWAEGIEMTKGNPLFGIGRGNFQSYTSKLIAHNSMIEIMGETGFIGLILWLMLVFLSLKNLVWFVRDPANERDKAFVIALFIAVVGYLISSMFVTLEYETFYILLALCSVVGRNNADSVGMTKQDLRNVIIMSLGFFLAIKLFVMFYFVTH